MSAEADQSSLPPPPRPDLKNLFSSAKLVSSNKNSKQALMFKSLQWRQAYQNLDHYRYEFEKSSATEEDFTFEMRQILNGEMKGLGTGTFVWPAAHILSKYLEIAYGKNKLAGKHVCDIGTGTGITGFIAAYLGANVVLTDQACVLDLLQENTTSFEETFRRHFPVQTGLGSLVIREYDWVSKNAVSDCDFDLLLISDCVLPKLYPIDLLLGAVDHLMRDHTVALFSYEHRPYAAFDPRQEFLRLCEARGLEVAVVPLSEHHSVYRAEDIEIWEVRRRRQSADHSHRNVVDDGRAKLVVHNWGEAQPVIEATLVTYPPDGMSVVPLRISQAASGGSTVGNMLWPSSVLCSRLLLSGQHLRPSLDSPSTVCLDVGAGCGLTSIVAHHLGHSIVATDRPSIVDGLLGANVRRYFDAVTDHREASQSSRLQCLSLDWEAMFSDASTSDWFEQLGDASIGCVLCSDCLYSSPAVQPLLCLLDTVALRERSLVQSRESETRTVSVQVLVVNELRSPLEEFLYFALHRPDPSITVRIREIPLTSPDLVLVRSPEAFHVSPPLRACLMTWSCKW